jgi:hypothetical protein
MLFLFESFEGKYVKIINRDHLYNVHVLIINILNSFFFITFSLFYSYLYTHLFLNYPFNTLKIKK